MNSPCLRTALSGIYIRHIGALGSYTNIPKRSRYFWEARPECRERKLLMQITLPRLKQAVDPTQFVQEVEEEKLYGLDVILHKEVQQIFNENELIAVCLYSEMPSDNFYQVRYELQQHGMSMEKYPEHVMEFTLKQTPYENMLELFRGETAVIFGEANVKQMISAVSKNNYLLLLGGLVQGRYMSLKELIKFSNLAGLDSSRAELGFLLNTAVSSTKNMMQKPTNQLVHSLQQYIEQCSNASNEN
uniref:Large ribosomal subunit protein uL10m n=1 Tax=Ciona intestinalis TaxID=7719 RepID=F6PHD5_CIOIN|nr:uncharacterized protein LOC100178933 [Ciona intestinalis]|eukprot:XP_002130196.1 uncharacterized protein LOC100178933 [Ciona intestinalis]